MPDLLKNHPKYFEVDFLGIKSGNSYFGETRDFYFGLTNSILITAIMLNEAVNYLIQQLIHDV